MHTLLPFVAIALNAPGSDIPLAGSFRYDPVTLVEKGEKDIGAATIHTDRYGYRYFFTSRANRGKFLRRPEKYEIQLGGGCGSMGPLSGRGSLDLFAVHEGRIYLFASDACRRRFLSMPEKLVPNDPTFSSGTVKEARRGRELLRKAAQWAGGSKAIDRLGALQFERREIVKSGDVDYLHTETLAFDWNGRISKTDRWNDSSFTDITDGKLGFSKWGDRRFVLHPQQIRELQRIRNGTLAAVLHAAGRPSTLAHARGETPAGLERVEVLFDRTRCVLEVDPADGQIAALEFSSMRATRGTERHEFAAFREVAGVKLPSAWTAFFGGKEYGKRSAADVSYKSAFEGISFDLFGKP